MGLIDSGSKSNRLLASRRYTHNTFTTAQESFTNVLDLRAEEIYTQASKIPSSNLPFSGSSQNGSVYTDGDDNILKYYYRKKLTKSNVNNEVWFFLNPTGSDSGIDAQLINSNQQTNFISPKYSVVSLTNANAEDNTPGYGVKVFKSTSLNSGSLGSGAVVSNNDYQFDYKTGVLQFLNSAVDPTNSQYVYMTAYQYVGKTLATRLELDGGVSGSATSTGSFGRIEATSLSGDGSALTNVFEGTTPSSSISTRLSNLSADSASFSSRITTAESELEETIVSASAQLAEQISGSFTAPSASLSTRITNLKTDSGSFSTRVSNLKTDSGSFSTRVSNLKTDSGSFSTRVSNLKTDSGSFSTRITADSSSFSTRVSDLKTDSGSFSTRITADSSSFSTRITTAETELEETIVSASAQLANQISGSFTAPSASFSTRISNLKTDSGSFSTRVSNLKTDSGSFSTRVSNLKTDSGSFSTRITADSSSFSTRVTDLETDSGSFSTRITADSGSFSTRTTNLESKVGQSLNTSDSPVFDGLRVTGDIHAERYIVSSSVSVITSSFSSGSTIFGDTIDDTHLFTGSLFISGNLTAVNITADSSSFSTRITTDSASFSTRVSGLKSDSGSFSTRITDDSGSFSTRVSNLKTDSGSFSTRITADSSSFSTRVSNLKTDSGSFSTRITADSSSISTRLTTEETNVDALQTDSGSFSSRITAITSSISALKTDSGSFSSRITAATSSISALKTDSGSFSTRITADSSSFSARVTTAEIELENTIISASAQISSRISGSFTAPSASFSTRVSNLKTDSGSFSTRITADSSSFSTRVTDLKTDSGSFSSRTTTLEGTGTVQGVGTTNDVLFNSITGSASALFEGGLLRLGKPGPSSGVDGKIILHNNTGTATFTLHNQDGNGRFGVSSDNNRTLTFDNEGSGDMSIAVQGNVTADGNISGSVTSTGSFGNLRVVGMSVPDVTVFSSSLSTRITNDSSSISTRITNDSSSFSARITNDSSSFSTRITNDSSSFSTRITADSSSFSTRVTDLKTDSGSFSTRVTRNEGTGSKILNGQLEFTNITASGNISGSSTSTGSFGRVETVGGIRANGQVNINSSFAQLRLSDDNFSDYLRIGQSGPVGYIKTSDADNDFRFRRGSDNTDLLTIDFGDEKLHFSGSGGLDVTGNITGSGHISMSLSSTGSVGRLEATTIGGHSPLTIDALTTFTNNITSSGQVQFDGKVFIETGSIDGDLHVRTNQDLMRIGKSTNNLRLSGSVSASRFATGSDGSIIDLGFTIIDEDGNTVLSGDGDGIHVDSNNYWYNNKFYRVGDGRDNFLVYDAKTLKYSGEVVAQTGSINGELHIQSPTGSMFIGKFTGGIPSSGSDNISRFATGSDGSIIDLGFIVVDEDGNSNLVNTGDGIHLDSNNYWYTSGHFKLGDDNNFINWNTSNLTVSGTFTGDGSGLTYTTLTSSGDFLVEGSVRVAEYIYHQGDNDTHLRFAPNLVNLVAGGKSAIKYDASSGKIIINNSNQNVDFHVMADDGEEILATDAANNRVGINTTTPSTALHVVGDTTVTGRLTVQELHTEIESASIIFTSGSTIFGNSLDDTHRFTGSMFISGAVSASKFVGDGSQLTGITSFDGSAGTETIFSGSATSTGSFGRIETAGDVVIDNGNVSGSSTSTGSFGKISVTGSFITPVQSKFTKHVGIGTDKTNSDQYTVLHLDSNGAENNLLVKQMLSINGTLQGSLFGFQNAIGFLDGDNNYAYRHITDSGHHWYVNNSEKMALTSGGFLNIGIVSTGPDTPLHVSEGEVSGIGSNSDAMVTFEREGSNNNESYVQFLTRTTGKSGLIFGDADSNDVARIQYNHGTNRMSIEHGGTIVSEFTSTMAISGSATSTGSFGKLLGDGSDLSGITGFPFTGSATISGSFSVDTGDGKVFEVSNETGSLFSVTDVSGVPALETFDDKRTVGRFERPMRTHTTDFTASAFHGGYYNIVSGDLTCSIIHPDTASVAIGTEFEFFQNDSDGRGLLFQTQSMGTTQIISKGNKVKLDGRGAHATLKKVDNDVYHLRGDLA